MLIGLFGTGRNGSSLIGRLLDGLQDTYVHPVEEIFLSKFDDLAVSGRVKRLTAQNCISKPLRHLDGQLPRGTLVRAYADSAETLHRNYMLSCTETSSLAKPDLQALLNAPSYDVVAFVREYLQKLGDYLRPDIRFRHQLFKSIETAYIEDYAARFPEMKFIHILRHPITVCSSQKRSLLENKKQPASYLGYDWLVCMLERRWLPHARFVVQQRDDPRHAVVLYEHLTENPGGELARVAALLGLDPPPRADVQTVFGNLDKSDWGFNPSKAGTRTPAEVVADLQTKLNYEEILSAREIDLINLKTGDLQQQLGYTQSTRPSRAEVLAQYAVLDRSEWANARGVRAIARAVYGAIYRRVAIF